MEVEAADIDEYSIKCRVEGWTLYAWKGFVNQRPRTPSPFNKFETETSPAG